MLSAGAPEEIRTPDPQIRSLVKTIEIIEVRYRKKLVGRGSTRILKLTQLRLLPKDSDLSGAFHASIGA